MADLSAEIETMENRWMRAWLQGDKRALKAATARDFILLVGSRPPVLLDNRSLIEAATTRWLCSSFRFGTLYVRKVGTVALFAGRLEMETTIDGKEWSGVFWVTDLWKKGQIRRGWRLAQRVISRIEDKPEVPSAIRELQLWTSGKRPTTG